jgi:hypothetical protein
MSSLGALQKWVVDALFKFPKQPKDLVRIIKITEQIEVDGHERNSSAPSRQSGFNKSAPSGKGRKKFGSGQKSKDQSKGGSSNKRDHQKGKLAMDVAKVATSLWSAPIRR